MLSFWGMKRSLRMASIFPPKTNNLLPASCQDLWQILGIAAPLSLVHIVYIYIHIIYCSHTYRFSMQLQTLYFFHTERHITSFWLLHLHQSPLWKVWQMIASWVSHPAKWCWLKNFSWPVLVLAAVLGAMHKDVHELLGEIVGWGIWKRG